MNAQMEVLYESERKMEENAGSVGQPGEVVWNDAGSDFDRG